MALQELGAALDDFEDGHSGSVAELVHGPKGFSTLFRVTVKMSRNIACIAEPGSSQKAPSMPLILLVEDNEMNRDMLSRRLMRRGFTVSIAVDGAEGVARCEQELPDLVIMDLSLPVLDGWEATRRIKSMPTTRHIPVIALTAHAMEGEDERARVAGCDDFETKPVELPRLLAKVAALLKLPPPTSLQ